MTIRGDNGRGVFYSRDSGGKHETTPGEYVEWARREAAKLDVDFRPVAEDVSKMIADGRPVAGDLYFDYDVSGHYMSRPALNAAAARVCDDDSVSHLFVPRRDRLARPNEPVEAVQMENQIRKMGVTLVFMDRVVPPLKDGERDDIAEQIVALLDYDNAGRFRRDLSEKMVYCQIALAKGGFSTGGRPPYGFDRWLVQDCGTKVRRLVAGERVRMLGHHVVWLPATDERLQIALRIRRLLLEVPATRVARILNEEGVPSPDNGRSRTDGGVRHQVSGNWHAPTIVNIGRNPLWAAVTRYGLRSMGEQTRTSSEGPRSLTGHDRRSDGKPKVIRNSEAVQIHTDAHFDPVVSREDHDELQRVLDARSTSQRGKPRSRDPKRNPLGGRVYDMGCTWPMYRVKRGKSFEYKCGQYMQTHGARCNHNRVDGLKATKVVMGCIRQVVSKPGALLRLQDKLSELAAAGRSNVEKSTRKREAQDLRKRLAVVADDLNCVQRNLSRARNDRQFQVIADEMEQLTAAKESLARRLQAVELSQRPESPVQRTVDVAMERLEALVEAAETDDGLATATHLIRETNARLFLDFKRVKQGKRTLNKPAGGVVVLGDAPDPIETYTGPTSPEKLKTKLSRGSSCCGGERISADSEPDGSESLRNVSRDDRI